MPPRGPPWPPGLYKPHNKQDLNLYFFYFFKFFFNDNLPPLFFGHRFPVTTNPGIFSDKWMNKTYLLCLTIFLTCLQAFKIFKKYKIAQKSQKTFVSNILKLKTCLKLAEKHSFAISAPAAISAPPLTTCPAHARWGNQFAGVEIAQNYYLYNNFC